MKLRSWFLFLIMIILWALNWSMVKQALLEVPPLTFVFHRFLVSFVSLFVLLLFLKPPIPRDRSTIKNILIVGLLNLGSVATAMGLSLYSSGISAVLTYTQPLMVFGLAVFFLNEEASKVKLVGTLLGFLGVLILFLESGSLFIFSLPIVLLILGAFSWSVQTIYYKRFLHRVDPVLFNTLQIAVGLPILSASSFTLEKPPLLISPTYITILLYSAIGATTISSTIWYFLLKDEDATTLSSSSFIIPILALGFGDWLLGENLDARSLIGSLFVLIGIYLVNR